MFFESILKENPVYIVDIGASGGLHKRWKKFNQGLRAILFEPDQKEYTNLKSILSENHIIINKALSDKKGEITFHTCRKQQVSSVYLPNFPHLNRFPEPERFNIIETVKLDADTLDNQLQKNNIDRVDFIKIDTQGHELSILKGAAQSLKQTIGLEVEVEFVQHYENQPLFVDVNNFIINFGFELFDLKRAFWKRKDVKNYCRNCKGQMVHGDALYLRSPENILTMPDISEISIVRAINIYLAYGCFDLAEILSRRSYSRGIISKKINEELNSVLQQQVDKGIIPIFWGKKKMHAILQKITDSFSDEGKYSIGDPSLGS